MTLFKKKSAAPGILTFTGGIPTALVDDHHEAFYWWWNSKLKNAALFHVDGHKDMNEAIVSSKLQSEKDYIQLNIANFICPAVYHNIISSIYWFNPHSEKKLQYFGKPITSFSEREGFFGENGIYEENDYKYDWGFFDGQRIWQRNGESVAVDDAVNEIGVSLDSRLILDIDLDAFCCHRNTSLGRNRNYNGVSGFEQRIDQTIEVLACLPKPKLITVASSQGDGITRCYVPPEKVKDVSSYLAVHLRKLYK